MINHINELSEFLYDEFKYSEFSDLIYSLINCEQDTKTQILLNFHLSLFNVKGIITNFEIVHDNEIQADLICVTVKELRDVFIDVLLPIYFSDIRNYLNNKVIFTNLLLVFKKLKNVLFLKFDIESNVYIIHKIDSNFFNYPSQNIGTNIQIIEEEQEKSFENNYQSKLDLNKTYLNNDVSFGCTEDIFIKPTTTYIIKRTSFNIGEEFARDCNKFDFKRILIINLKHISCKKDITNSNTSDLDININLFGIIVMTRYEVKNPNRIFLKLRCFKDLNHLNVTYYTKQVESLKEFQNNQIIYIIKGKVRINESLNINIDINSKDYILISDSIIDETKYKILVNSTADQYKYDQLVNFLDERILVRNVLKLYVKVKRVMNVSMSFNDGKGSNSDLPNSNLYAKMNICDGTYEAMMNLNNDLCRKFFNFGPELKYFYNKYNDGTEKTLSLYDNFYNYTINNENNIELNLVNKIKQKILENDVIVYGVLRYHQSLKESNTPKKRNLNTQEVKENVFVNGYYCQSKYSEELRKMLYIKAIDIITDD